jgi:hypothetical protein
VRGLVTGMVLVFIGQTLIWYQTNGQFLWEWFKKNPLLLSIGIGSVVSYLFIMGTKYIVTYFDGLLWPGRFITFGMGILSFTFLTWLYMGEGITLKTFVSLLLAISLVSIQILWK